MLKDHPVYVVVEWNKKKIDKTSTKRRVPMDSIIMIK